MTFHQIKEFLLNCLIFILVKKISLHWWVFIKLIHFHHINDMSLRGSKFITVINFHHIYEFSLNWLFFINVASSFAELGYITLLAFYHINEFSSNWSRLITVMNFTKFRKLAKTNFNDTNQFFSSHRISKFSFYYWWIIVIEFNLHHNDRKSYIN